MTYDYVRRREEGGKEGRTLELFGRETISSSPFWLLFHSLLCQF